MTGALDIAPNTDAVTVINAAIAATTIGGTVFLKPGVYTLNSPILLNVDGVKLCGSGVSDVINNLGTQLLVNGNFNGVTITGRSSELRDVLLLAKNPQTSGIGVLVSAYNVRITRVNIGSVQNVQHFFIGMEMDGNSKYSFASDMIISNCISKGIYVTGAANNRTISRVSIVNWGANIFTNNPDGFYLDTSFGGDFFTDISVATCGIGLHIATGNTQTLFEEYFLHFDVVNNWGQGVVITCASGGRVTDMVFVDLYCATNAQAAASTVPGLAISATGGSISSLRFIGGEISNHPNEGLFIGPTTGAGDTFTAEIDMLGVSIHDNNIGNTTKTYDGFGAIALAGVYVNASNCILKIFGGELDNPGTGTAGGNPGHQSGLIVSRAGDVRIIFVELSRNQSAPFGDASGGKTRVIYCHGYTPFARLAITVGSSPFVYQNTDPFPENICVTGGTVSQVAVSRDNVTYDNLYTTTGCQVHLAKGDYVKVTYSVLPTMTKYGLEA